MVGGEEGGVRGEGEEVHVLPNVLVNTAEPGTVHTIHST